MWQGNWNHLKMGENSRETWREDTKTVILGTTHTHTLRTVLMWKQKTFSMGNNISCPINCNYRTAATLCTLESLFFVIYVIVNTLHKGNMMMMMMMINWVVQLWHCIKLTLCVHNNSCLSGHVFMFQICFSNCLISLLLHFTHGAITQFAFFLLASSPCTWQRPTM